MDDRAKALQKHRRALLALEPRARVDAVLSSPRPAEMVRSLPAQEFYLTIVETGLDQALPLIPLAATRQIEFIFDIDCWTADEFDPRRAAYWLATLQQADPDAVTRWLREAEENLVVLTLLRSLRVYKADESSDQAFWPPDRPVPSHDGIYFVEARDEAVEEAFPALWEGLARLRSADRNAYDALLEQVLWAAPPELEEEAYQQRAGRLAEKGFPEFDEAVEVWAAGPESQPDVRARMAETLATQPPPVGSGLSPSLPALFSSNATPALARAAAALDDDRREQLLSDLIRLGNRFAAASLASLGEPETHHRGLATALSFVNLGLHELAGGQLDQLGPRALAHLSVFELNRAGVGAVIQRARRAHEIAARGWLSRVHLARERLDHSLEETLAGLLDPRPRFTAGGADRPFREPADLRVIDDSLATIAALGEFLESCLQAGRDEFPELTVAPARRESPHDIEWSAVALTTIARVALGDPPRPATLDAAAARRALGVLLTNTTPRCASQRLRDIADSLLLGPAAAFLGQVLERDAGELPPNGTPDPRFVRALLFR